MNKSFFFFAKCLIKSGISFYMTRLKIAGQIFWTSSLFIKYQWLMQKWRKITYGHTVVQSKHFHTPTSMSLQGFHPYSYDCSFHTMCPVRLCVIFGLGFLLICCTFCEKQWQRPQSHVRKNKGINRFTKAGECPLTHEWVVRQNIYQRIWEWQYQSKFRTHPPLMHFCLF